MATLKLFTFNELITAFLCCLFLREIHEQLHQLSAFLLTGSWPYRDIFNQYFSVIPTESAHALILLSGPILNYIIGLYLLFNNTSKTGAILSIAILPLSRMMAFFSGGGDEYHAFKILMPDLALPAGIMFILGFYLLQIYLLSKQFSSKKEWTELLLILASFSLLERMVLSSLNLVHQIVPSQTILGTPLLVWIWLLILAILLIKNKFHVQKKV